MDWINEYKERMDSPLFKCLLDSYSHLDENETTRVLIKLKSGTSINKLKDLCELSPSDLELNHAVLLNYLSGKLSVKTIQQLVVHPKVEKLYLDRKVQAFLDTAAKSMGKNYVNNIYGLTGKGVTIAVLDTGIHPHSDFTLPSNRIVGFVDMINRYPVPYDDHGHGTHVAGCAAGNGFASKGRYSSLAPEAQLVGVKVLDKNGVGYLSTVISGINYCIEKKALYNIKIINLSLGSESIVPYQEDPLSHAAEQAMKAGIIVLMAADHTGLADNITTFATNPNVITVGAASDRKTPIMDDEYISLFTSKLQVIDSVIKPDVFFPGLCITAPLSPNSILANQLEPFVVNQNYITLSGSSMATGLCSGAIALILSAYPPLSSEKMMQLFLQYRQGVPNIESYVKLPHLFQLLLKTPL
ncbi:S8 family peptidase [uncultured Metabacillus sp.]|nr:S8 family peptidase [uncultured Metabacillus sp.]